MADPENQEQVEQQVEQEAEVTEQAVRDTEKELLSGAFERKRDPETGKFVRKEGEAEEPPEPAKEPTQETAKEPVKEEEDVLPSWRVREINEERRRVQAENEQMRVELAKHQARQAQVDRDKAPPQENDPLLDPAGYTNRLRQEFRNELAIERLNMNLEMSHMRHGEKFEKAYEALITEGQRGNRALINHLTAQANPGEAIVRWFTQNEVLREVGPDPAAYKQKTREELLNDPEFLQLAEQRLRERAMGGPVTGNGQPRPNTVVKLPPTLSKAAGSSGDPDGTATDGSESALFAYAMKPRR